MAATNTNTVAVLGELFQQGKRPNNFLRMIGGIQGGVAETTSREFPVSVLYNLRAPSQPAVLEGANAPAATTQTVTQATNVVQIHQETVSLTYLGESDKTMSGVIPLPQGKANGPIQNPRSEAFQVSARMEVISRDVNYSFVQGVFNNPADATAGALRTRGIMTAIVTNAVDHSADVNVTPAMYRKYIESLLKQVVKTNGYNPDDDWTICAADTEYGNIQAAYEAAGTVYLQPEVEKAGIKIRRILTRFGYLNIMIEPDMPDQVFSIFDLSVVRPVVLPVTGKGTFFMEPLAKTGSADSLQLYGQIGLDHGPEFAHGYVKVPAGLSL